MEVTTKIPKGAYDEIVPPVATSPIDAMRGRGKWNATASAVVSPAASINVTRSSITGNTKHTKHSVSKRCGRNSCSEAISILIISEKTAHNRV